MVGVVRELAQQLHCLLAPVLLTSWLRKLPESFPGNVGWRGTRARIECALRRRAADLVGFGGKLVADTGEGDEPVRFKRRRIDGWKNGTRRERELELPNSSLTAAKASNTMHNDGGLTS